MIQDHVAIMRARYERVYTFLFTRGPNFYLFSSSSSSFRLLYLDIFLMLCRRTPLGPSAAAAAAASLLTCPLQLEREGGPRSTAMGVVDIT